MVNLGLATGGGEGGGEGAGEGGGEGFHRALTAHVGSAASPLMSRALVMQRDAIVNHWTGEKDTTVDLGELLHKNDEYLYQLQDVYRAQTIRAVMRAAVQVDGDAQAGKATMYVQGESGSTKIQQPLLTVYRPEQAYFEKDLIWLRAYADLRTDRIGEVHLQLGDLLSFYAAAGYLDDAGRRKNSRTLLGLTQDLALHVHSIVKYYCRAPRPIDFTIKVQPMIQTPDHSSFPSGHATEAFAIATVLHRLATGQSAEEALRNSKNMPMPFRIAHRIAANRTVAGVHFPVDSRAGAWIGCHVGELVYALAEGKPLTESEFQRPPVPGDHEQTKDFLLSNFKFSPSGNTVTPSQLSVVGKLWTEAVAEWPRGQGN